MDYFKENIFFAQQHLKEFLLCSCTQQQQLQQQHQVINQQRNYSTISSRLDSQQVPSLVLSTCILDISAYKNNSCVCVCVCVRACVRAWVHVRVNLVSNEVYRQVIFKGSFILELLVTSPSLYGHTCQSRISI